jgi:hypothetical protein
VSAGIVASHLAEMAAVEEQARLRAYQQRWRAYDGDHPKPLKVKPNQPDDNLIVNKARVIVDTGLAFLFGEELRFELDKAKGTEGEAERWLDACWRANRKMTLLQKAGLNGGVCGTTYVRIVPADAKAGFPRLLVLDPATVRVLWEPDDIDRVVAYRVQYPAIDPRTGKPIAKRQAIDRDGTGWRIVDQVSRPDSGVWETLAETRWPWAFSPIVHNQNLPVPNEFYGRSDLEDDVLALNRGRNFVLSNMARIIRFHAHPKTYTKGIGGAKLNVDVDGTINLPSKDSEIGTVEMASDLASSLELDRRIDEALHEIARVPAIATGKVEDIGQLSGLAMQILHRPLVQMTKLKRLTYGDMIADLNARLLEMAKHGAGRQTTLVWPELLPSDPKAEREVAILDEQLGASTETLLGKLGYDAKAEAKKKQAEAKAGAELGQAMLTQFERGQEDAPEQGGRRPGQAGQGREG